MRFHYLPNTSTFIRIKNKQHLFLDTKNQTTASYIWNNIQRLSLMNNMRVLLTGDSSTMEFAASLLKLVNGAMVSENQDGTISMNNIGKTVATLQQLKDAVFPNVARNFHDHKWS